MKHVQTDMIVVVMQRAAEGAVTKQTERFCNDQSKWRDISRRTNQSIEQIDVTGLKRGKTRVTKS